jgi:hypothetical protein
MERVIRVYAALAFAVLLQTSAAVAQTEVSLGPPRPDSPKTVTFRFTRSADTQFSLDRIINSTVVLEQDGAKYVSSKIKIHDLEGICTIAEVPPGKYTLKIEYFKLSTTILIPERDIRAISFDVKIGSVFTICMR